MDLAGMELALPRVKRGMGDISGLFTGKMKRMVLFS
jgi:hypothetical protein